VYYWVCSVAYVSFKNTVNISQFFGQCFVDTFIVQLLTLSDGDSTLLTDYHAVLNAL
jgi:hypothetical protein